MAYIHKQGITHRFVFAIGKCVQLLRICRDLKPENVLLTNDDPPIAKVADFGLAKLVDEGTFLKVGHQCTTVDSTLIVCVNTDRLCAVLRLI
jgi:serine/threonine protein kinase